ncbi:MAG: hypothetical protein HPY75_09240 [Actinobacteria bacterium]|nr:hypothetical protein [Actinomycetota bacterium]
MEKEDGAVHREVDGEGELDMVERAVAELREDPEREDALDLLEQAVKGLEEAGNKLEEEG